MLKRDLKDVSEDISDKSEVINVISNFQPVGYEIRGLSKNSIVIFAALAFIAMIGIILLLKLNKFLESYKSK
jgi:type IV secretory pathway component VirB8